MKALIAAILVLSGTAMGETKYPKSNHYNGDLFHNPGEKPFGKSLWEVIKWKLTSDVVEFPEKVPIENYPLRPLMADDLVNVTFINHATMLIQLPGLNILTDPVYSERVSPLSFMGPKRVKEPGLPFDVLPKIDIVTVSHNHYDHLDIDTLKRLDDKFHPLFLVPLGDEVLLGKSGIQNIKAMDWWEEVKVKDTVITFTPAQHWSGRTLWDRNECLWGGFMINNGAQKIFHAGDTGMGPHFLEIKTRLGNPDLALLPIGAYKPRWFMKHQHMTPEEAVEAHKILAATRSIGMHFGTFQLTDEGINEPKEDLIKAREKAGLKAEDFLVLDQGQALSY